MYKKHRSSRLNEENHFQFTVIQVLLSDFFIACSFLFAISSYSLRKSLIVVVIKIVSSLGIHFSAKPHFFTLLLDYQIILAFTVAPSNSDECSDKQASISNVLPWARTTSDSNCSYQSIHLVALLKKNFFPLLHIVTVAKAS